jgi:hypothetical protein
MQGMPIDQSDSVRFERKKMRIAGRELRWAGCYPAQQAHTIMHPHERRLWGVFTHWVMTLKMSHMRELWWDSAESMVMLCFLGTEMRG